MTAFTDAVPWFGPPVIAYVSVPPSGSGDSSRIRAAVANFVVATPGTQLGPAMYWYAPTSVLPATSRGLPSRSVAPLSEESPPAPIVGEPDSPWKFPAAALTNTGSAL